jgi:hypothetical protein
VENQNSLILKRSSVCEHYSKLATHLKKSYFIVKNIVINRDIEKIRGLILWRKTTHQINPPLVNILSTRKSGVERPMIITP